MEYVPVSFHSRSAGASVAAIAREATRAFPGRTVPGPFGPAGRAAMARLGMGLLRRSSYPLMAYSAILMMTTALSDGGGWPVGNPEQVVNPSLDFIRSFADRLHPIGPTVASRNGSKISTVDSGYQTVRNSPNGGWPNPDPYWWNTQNAGRPDGKVPAGWYFAINGTVALMRPGISRRMTRSIDVYRNRTDQLLPSLVQHWIFPKPLGVPVPAGFARAWYPINRTMFNWRRIRKAASYPGGDLTIDLKLDGINVHVITAHPPTPSIKREVKGRRVGTAGYLAAHTAFALWNLATDWRDWALIVGRYTPGLPKAYRDDPNLILGYYRDHPERLLAADWASISVALFGWAVDEKIGAAIGQLTQKASMGIGGLIRLREGVSGAYDPFDYIQSDIETAKTPGAWLTEGIFAFFKEIEG